MRFAGGLPAVLFGTAIVIVQLQIATALKPTEVSPIAQQITVRIDGAGTGSGVIIERQGNTYTILTNLHVVQFKGSYTVQTPDGKKYTFNRSQVQPLPGVDLAVFQFTSNQNYSVAEKGNSEQVTLGTTIHVAGYPQGSSSISFLSGSISSRVTNLKDGYGFVYTVNAFPDMSGGPILDEQGKLIGIHGRSITHPDTNAVTVYGIPLKTYLSLISSVKPVATAPTPKPNSSSVSSTSINTDTRVCVYGWKLFKASPKEAIDEVWQIVYRQYVDGTFNQLDWQAVRKEYLTRSYSSQQEACQAIQEMIKKLGDPYTKLINPEEFQKMQIGMSRELMDIGIQGRIEIAPVEYSQKQKEFQIEIGMSSELRELMDIGIQGRIDIAPLEYSQKQIEFGKVGYIRLKQFNSNASQKMQNAIKDLESKHVVGYILDLRDNPGGLLLSSVEIARMWLDKGTIVSIIDRSGEQEREIANGSALTNKPLVILVNQSSAGTSEIISAALKDNKRAVLVGTRTFGKGRMQAIRPLDNGSALSLSTAIYLTPNGHNTHKKGIIPDVNIELTQAQQRQLSSDRQKIATSYDPHYTKALSILRTQIAAKGN